MIIRRGDLPGHPYRQARNFFRCVALFFICVLSFGSSSQSSEDPVLVCKKKYNTEKESYLTELHKIESDFMTFRWVEAKIRDLYYHHLGPTRQDRKHLFSKNKREEAKDEEDRLLNVLKSYENDSKKASNGALASTRNLKNKYVAFSRACSENLYEKCILNAFEFTNAKLDLLERDLETVFERERNYRKAVEVSVAGREGLYAEAALDISDQEADYYWRFEAEKEIERYQDNKKMLTHFHEIYRLVTDRFPGDGCCYQCTYIEERSLENVQN